MSPVPDPTILCRDMTESLADAAFGTRPGELELPGSAVPVERWMRAVAWGGQGHYSRSRAELATLAGIAGEDSVASLAWSTQASLLRQLGWHSIAAGFDGKALALAGMGREGAAETPLMREARCDALTGLAADALGCGRLALGWRLLDRCGTRLTGGVGLAMWRQRVRHHWVSAELSLAGGDFAGARRHADAAAEISRVAGSVRHHIKSDLLRSASMTGMSDSSPAVRLAADVLGRCDEYGLMPLKWAAAMLLSGVSNDSHAEGIRLECEEIIRARGGRFRI